METIMLFTSNAFQISSDPNGPPLGRDVAEHLRQRLEAQGMETSCSVEATEGWEFDAVVRGEKYSVFVHWAPIGNPAHDHWVVQPRKQRSIVATLLKCTPSADALRPICDVFRDTLADDEQIRDVRWVTSDEFRKLY